MNLTAIERTIVAVHVEKKIGSPKETWEGPKPHDFRNMAERGVRFVHSTLMCRSPDNEMLRPNEPGEPTDRLEFRIVVGDVEAGVAMCQRIADAGFPHAIYEQGKVERLDGVKIDPCFGSVSFYLDETQVQSILCEEAEKQRQVDEAQLSKSQRIAALLDRLPDQERAAVMAHYDTLKIVYERSELARLALNLAAAVIQEGKDL